MPAKQVVLAEYFTTEDRTLLFIVSNKIIDELKAPLIREIKMPLKEIRQVVETNFGTTEGVASKVNGLNVDEWQRYFGQFIEPILPHASVDDIIWFVPHDMLHYLPLHALKAEGRYLIERNPVCYAPSASVMQFCHAKRKNRREKALVIGDSRSNLLYAPEEAFTVAELFGTRPYLQQQATKALVKEKLEKERDQLDILHFSCHGYFDSQEALKSGIKLAPEQESTADAKDESWNLTAEEIFSLSMDADLVTLSACKTGVNAHKPGDELIGLTRALIYAGTPSVIVSLWAVDDLSTDLLMQHFYQQLRRPVTENSGQPVMKVEALRAAQLHVKNLTAQDVVKYCNQRLAQLNRPEEAERALSYLLGRANAQIIANDPTTAIDTLRDLQKRLSAIVNGPTTELAGVVSKRLSQLKRRSQKTTPNDQVKPFESPYYWAPFVLIGDWK